MKKLKDQNRTEMFGHIITLLGLKEKNSHQYETDLDKAGCNVCRNLIYCIISNCKNAMIIFCAAAFLTY